MGVKKQTKKMDLGDAVEKTHEYIKENPGYWIKNESGKKSASLTFAVVAFAVSTLWFGLSAVEGIGSVKFREFDPAAAGAYLAPTLALYWGRRNTRAKNDTQGSVIE